MTTAQARAALIAMNRFGLGAKPGGLAAIAADPKAALIAELNTAGIAGIVDSTLPTYAKSCKDAVTSYAAADANRKREFRARMQKHHAVPIGFVERLVMFWSNHFSMSVYKNTPARGMIGEFERSVIRKNVLGKFSTMLRAAIRHPAMITYLDNDDSIGPNSTVGFRRRVSYTENLGREILELHTAGTGNYTQDDVAALSKMLTGWSFVRRLEALGRKNGGTPANMGQFIYRPDWHEQGPIQFQGKVFPDEGVKQADKALALIARHPGTARHIAYKLVRHFIADEPTDAMVEPVRLAFRSSGGDLKAVALALLDLEEAWQWPMTRLRPPYEAMVAQYRAADVPYVDNDLLTTFGILDGLRNQPWAAPSPEGWTDESDEWETPDSVLLRIKCAQHLAYALLKRKAVDPVKSANGAFGQALSSATRERVAGAGPALAGLTILFASPEMQRR